MQTWINRFVALCCLLLSGVATADDQQAKKHLVDASLMFATLDAGGSDNFHTGRMLQINYNYYFTSWLAASAGVIATEEIAEEPQQDIAGEFRGIIQTNALVLGLRPEYVFSDRNRVYARTSVLAYFSELQVEEFFGSGLPNGITSHPTDGYGYLLGFGWADAENGNFERALVPWMALRNRDLLDSAVQESMLAIPYAMAMLDGVSQAADHYLNAIEAFYEETSRIDEAIVHIESGELLDQFLEQNPQATTGWYWKLEELPEGPDSRYLYHLLATHKFQEGIKNYRDLHYLKRNLDDWQQSVEVFGNMLDTREYAYNQRLPRIEESLGQADLDGMVNEKLEFDSTLNNIEVKSKERWFLWNFHPIPILF